MTKAKVQRRGMKNETVLDPRIQEILRAGERIGVSNFHMMGWAVEFLQRDLDHLSTGDWLNLQYEIGLFIWRHGPAFQLPFSNKGVEIKPDTIPILDHGIIADLQRLTRERIDEFLTTGKATFLSSGDVAMIVRKMGLGECHISYETGTPRAGFEHSLAQTLRAMGNYVSKCPECGVTFIRVQKNKKFCSARCLSRVTTRRLRQVQGRRASNKRMAGKERANGTKRG
jgi:hypothetical protein